MVKVNYLKNVLLMSLMTVFCFLAQSCSDDDYTAVDNKAPVVALTTHHIQTEPGRSFSIQGVITDADGLKSITLENSDMYLDKTIDLLEYHPDSLLHTYNLNYKYAAKDTWTDNEQFKIKVTAQDVMGNITEDTLLVTPDGDFTAPVFTSAPASELTVLLQNPKLTLNTVLSDNKDLQYLKIAIPGLSINDSIAISGKSYTLSKTYDMPAKEATYQMFLTLADAANNTVTDTCTIKVSDLPDFDKMYLADVSTVDELNSDLYGVPMLIEHTGQYQYRARYYNQKAGTGIRFIPQKTDFNPICFGVDESTGLLTSNPSVAQPIILSKVGYYEIDFNTVTGEYDVKTYTPTTAQLDVDGTQTIDYKDGSGSQTFQICLAGAGLPNTPSWTTNPNNSAFILYQSKTNPYLLYREMTLTKGTKVSFTISATHIWGWWPQPYWRFDNSAQDESNVLDGGDNMTEVVVPATGTYRFEFDYSLLRSRIILVK